MPRSSPSLVPVLVPSRRLPVRRARSAKARGRTKPKKGAREEDEERDLSERAMEHDHEISDDQTANSSIEATEQRGVPVQVQSSSASSSRERHIHRQPGYLIVGETGFGVKLAASSKIRPAWMPPRMPSRHGKKELQKQGEKRKTEARADCANQSRGAHSAEEAPRCESRGRSKTSHDASDTGEARVEPRGADVEEADDYDHEEPVNCKAPEYESGDYDHEEPDHDNGDRKKDDEMPREESRKQPKSERDDEALTAPTASSSEDGRVQRTDPPGWPS